MREPEDGAVEPAGRPPLVVPTPVPVEEAAEQLGQREYTFHALRHELTGDDTVRLSVQANGVQLNRYRTLNFVNLPVSEDSTNKRFNIGGDFGVRAYNSIAITIGSGVTSLLGLDSERWDTQNYHNLSPSSRLTVPAAGTYLVTGHVEFASNNAGVRIIYLQVNGATYAQQSAVPLAGLGTPLSVSTIVRLNAGDYVELAAYQTSGGPLSVSAVPGSSPELALQRIA